MSRTALLPVALLFVAVLSLTAAGPWALVALVVPLLAAAWVLRVGVDVSDEGITVRQIVGARTVAWGELAGIRVGRRRSLWLVTTHGTEIAVPVLRVGDLPRLAELSDGRIPQVQ
jgi:Bacterial PH domain